LGQVGFLAALDLGGGGRCGPGLDRGRLLGSGLGPPHMHSPICLDSPQNTNYTLTLIVSSFYQVLCGMFILRFVVGPCLTEEHHVIVTWKILQDEATKLLRSLWIIDDKCSLVNLYSCP
jgi:hypothetical protein